MFFSLMDGKNKNGTNLANVISFLQIITDYSVEIIGREKGIFRFGQRNIRSLYKIQITDSSSGQVQCMKIIDCVVISHSRFPANVYE